MGIISGELQVGFEVREAISMKLLGAVLANFEVRHGRQPSVDKERFAVCRPL